MTLQAVPAPPRTLREIAIDEGSTLIRVGSAIFGDRPPHAS